MDPAERAMWAELQMSMLEDPPGSKKWVVLVVVPSGRRFQATFRGPVDEVKRQAMQKVSEAWHSGKLGPRTLG
jgi:hypothetical protein